MFHMSFDEIMKKYPHKSILSKYALAKLPAEIVNSMECLAGKELSCDCIFTNDDGRYLYENRDDANQYVLIATDGQGDEWLLRLSDRAVCFLDHDIWEEREAVYSMGLSFQQFVIMADVLGKFEGKEESEENIEMLKAQLNSIRENLVEDFPFTL